MSERVSNKTIHIYTDGACSGNPGPGGWGFVYVVPMWRTDDIGTPTEPLMVDGKQLWVHTTTGKGGEKDTTNNRMELLAVINGLHHIRSRTDYDLTVVTDSKYVLQGITEWIKGWKSKGWIGSNKKPVKNRDLWERLDALSGQFSNLKWKWVKGHAGNQFNEMADELSVAAIPKE